MENKSLVQAVHEQLRAEMAARNVSGKDLAQISGVSYPSLVRYIRGQRDIPLVVLVSALTALDIDAVDFWERATQRTTETSRSERGEHGIT